MVSGIISKVSTSHSCAVVSRRYEAERGKMSIVEIIGDLAYEKGPQGGNGVISCTVLPRGC